MEEIDADESLDEEGKYEAKLARYKEGISVARTTFMGQELWLNW